MSAAGKPPSRYSRAALARVVAVMAGAMLVGLPSSGITGLEGGALRPAFAAAPVPEHSKAPVLPLLRAALGPSPLTVLRGAKAEPPAVDRSPLGTSAEVIAFIKEQEGLSLVAFTGPGGCTLIGYGHRTDAPLGTEIALAEAERLLKDDIAVMEAAVHRAVKVPMTKAEFSAMVALAYNIGPNAFARSSVARRLNAGDRDGAAEAFLLWTKLRRDGTLVESSHLKARRQAERDMFRAGTA
ncbi:MAG: lysozyme [Alphaproteobacteria bacterium]|nr:lysozyme [Alphaproteobacteria bacterium]